MSAWQQQGQYEFEYDERGYTGWYRCARGRMANGSWPEWNHRTGAERGADISTQDTSDTRDNNDT